MLLWEHPSNIHAAAGFPSTFVNFASVSETFHQLSVCPQNLLSTSINILSVRRKYFVPKLDLPRNFRQLSVWLRVLPSSFCASEGPSVVFHKHFVQLRTSVNLRQLASTFCAAAGPSVHFPCSYRHYVNFPCTRTTFCQLPSTFCASKRPFANFPYGSGAFRQISVWPRTFCQLYLLRNYPSIFCASTGPSVNFCQFSLSPRDIPSTSIKFSWFRGIFHQHFLHSWDILSTSVNFSCTRSIFRKQYARPQNLPSASVNCPCICGTYHKLASTFHEAGWPFVSISCSRWTCLLRSTSSITR